MSMWMICDGHHPFVNSLDEKRRTKFQDETQSFSTEQARPSSLIDYFHSDTIIFTTWSNVNFISKKKKFHRLHFHFVWIAIKLLVFVENFQDSTHTHAQRSYESINKWRRRWKAEAIKAIERDRNTSTQNARKLWKNNNWREKCKILDRGAKVYQIQLINVGDFWSNSALFLSLRVFAIRCPWKDYADIIGTNRILSSFLPTSSNPFLLLLKLTHRV